MQSSNSVITSPRNEYRGPNAHLLSLQQTPRPDVSLWKRFHNAFIVYITSALNEQLPDGYVAVSDQALQIQIEMPEAEPTRTSPRFPDSAVYRDTPTPNTEVASIPVAIAEPDLVIPDVELPDIDSWAVVIYRNRPNAELGDPVARIELLSNSNKRNGRESASYMAGRRAALRTKTILYELDLLHESQSPLIDIPTYPDDEGSHPYCIAVTDPRRARVETLVKGFDVDEPFPLVNILLMGQDMVKDFDFGRPYNETFERGRWGNRVNYAELPDPQREQVMLEKKGKTVAPAISAYNPQDQERIRQRMEAVAKALRTTH